MNVALKFQLDSHLAVYVADWVRVFDMLVGLFVGCLILRQIFLLHNPQIRRYSRGAFGRFVALALADISIVFTEAGRIHQVVTWRLFVNTLALLWALVGVSQFPFKEPWHGKDEPK